jgi:hypothetical protein
MCSHQFNQLLFLTLVPQQVQPANGAGHALMQDEKQQLEFSKER